ncbi:dual specificity protein phosphatase 12 [Osmerus eperlanus]|uniref:dual specificity protein phosphatase 12 n=1 Tax=Osmerus eperlanus TaxID=29151 RepID=UPI002E0F8E40
MILVDPGVYIGAVTDLTEPALAEAAVTHILSVDSEEPVLSGGPFTRKFLRLQDEPTSDLLSHLDQCLAFILDATVTNAMSTTPTKTATVLVHCHAGRSRSAAVATAYLMRQHQLSFQEAYCRLQQATPHVEVNQGFQEQLCLYESMGCQLDTSSPLYKQYRLQKITEKYPELQSVPREVFVADPAQGSAPNCPETTYRCRKCRRTLFRESSLLSHPIGGGASSFSYRKCLPPGGGDQSRCTSYFIEPVQWMEQALLGVMDGQLLCPKCSSKLGSFSWCGDRCSCGHWVTPAFQIHQARVDRITR